MINEDDFPKADFFQANFPKAFSRYHRKRRTQRAGKVIALIASLVVGVVMAVAVMAVFPTWGVGWAIAIGCSTFYLEVTKYLKDTQKSLSVVFVKGIFANLENNLMTRELLADEKIEADLWALYQERVFKTSFNRINNSDKKQHQKEFKKFVKRAVEAWKDEEGNHPITKFLIDKYGEIIFAQKRQKIARELLTKKVLSVFALGIATVCGLLFGMFTFTHTALALLQFLIFVGAGAALTTWLVPVIAGIAAVILAIAYTQMMYRMLSKAIEKDFGKLIKSLKKIFLPKQPFSKLSAKQILLHLLKCALIGILFGAVFTLAVLVTLGTSGTLLDQSIAFLKTVANWFTQVTAAMTLVFGWVSAISIYVFFLPTAFYFALNTSWESLTAFMKPIRKFLSHPKEVLQSIKEKIATTFKGEKSATEWVKLIGYALVYTVVSVITVAALVLDQVASSAYASEGLSHHNIQQLSFFDKVSSVFEKISNFIRNIFGVNVNAEQVAAGAAFIGGVFEHSTFILGAHDHGVSYPEAAGAGTYNLIGKILGEHNTSSAKNDYELQSFMKEEELPFTKLFADESEKNNDLDIIKNASDTHSDEDDPLYLFDAQPII